VYEHRVYEDYRPKTKSPHPFGQKNPRLEAVNEHAFRDDFVVAADAGWDHLYHWGLAEWKEGLQILHTFERGFGPRSMAFSRQGFMNVLGEYDPAFAVLAWDEAKKNFTEVARH
jgi:6-phosphogluconolactonase (cycloisomerase 2 family)